MKSKKFLLLLVVTFTIYALPEILFGNAMLYLSGGIIGGTLSEVFKEVSEGINTFLVFLIWMLLLLGLIFLFIKSGNKALKYLVLLLIAFFLYVIDNLLAFMPMYEMGNAVISHWLFKFLSVLSKSLILSLIIYFGWKRKEVKTTG